jgi:hypothetical protein
LRSASRGTRNRETDAGDHWLCLPHVISRPVHDIPQKKNLFRNRDRPAHPFSLASPLLAVNPALLRCLRRLCFFPRLRFFRGLADELDQSLDCIFTVPLLRAESLCIDDEDAFLSNPSACQTNKARAYVAGKSGRIPRIKPELDCRGHLVHILSPRARRTNKVQLYFVLIERYGSGDGNHHRTLHYYH